MAIVNKKTGETLHVGCVLRISNHYRMDLFVEDVLFYNRETGEFETTTLCGDLDPRRAEVDFTDDIEELFRAYEAYRNQKLTVANNHYHKRTIKKGATVKVVRGRKIKKGTVGIVTKAYKSDLYTTVYIQTENGEEKTYLRNLEIEVDGEFVVPNFSIDNENIHFERIRLTGLGNY